VPPNLLLIVFDTARADAFEPYGAGIGASPAVAQLASTGSTLPYAYAPSNWTLPSHVSMLTGLTPRESGLAQAPGGDALACRPYVEAMGDLLMPEVLRRRGYATRAVSANGWVSSAVGFATGFEEFHDVRGTRKQTPAATDIRGRIGWALESVYARVDDGAEAARELIGTWIKQNAQPFFWLVNLVECHSPYLPPRPYNDISLRARLRAAQDVKDHQTLAAVWRACIVRDPIPSDALARMRHLYGRAIRMMDDWLARVLEMLDSARLLDDTLVVVTSDHGENLGESNLVGHAFSLDERLIRIPLITAGPGALAGDGPMSLVHLPKLIADGLGLKDHPWEANAVPDGIVVSEYDSMGTRDDPKVVRVTGEWSLDDGGIARLTSRGTSATNGRVKLVREAGRELLYDLVADPLENSPVEAQHNADPLVLRLRASIEKAEAERALVKPRAVATSEDEREDLEERLKLLGYL